MKIFTDYNGETEILSDSYPITEVFDGCGYEVQSALLNKGGETIDIGCGNAFGEPKEEEKEEVEQVNNILDTFSYQEQTFDKAGYVTYIKTYMKDLREYLEKSKPARLEAFKKGTAEMVKWILANFDTFTFYCNKEWEADKLIILAYTKKEGDQPTFLYFVDGMKSFKV